MLPKPVLCIVGLGYVGLPLAHAFAEEHYEVYGFDVSAKRIEELSQGIDRTRELSTEQLKSVTIRYSIDPTVIKNADVVILAIPTPVDERNNPDLSPVEAATHTVGKNLKRSAIIVSESTVYPGVTEEICGPILEKESGLRCGIDFTLGYSPERVNPGDKEHTVRTIKKIVSGQDARTLETLAALYGSIVRAGIHKAPSIKVAEMAKAIENAQRDLNIAYVNEIAMLCNRIGIESKDVLAAAGTKWNFLPFQPGLVGGHCIGVDPYYLVEKAKQLDMTTKVITTGRAVNDGMSTYIADRIIAHLRARPETARALVLGLTFKEDVPDLRNSKVRDVITALEKHRMQVEVHDASYGETELSAMGLKPGSLDRGPYDAILYLVPHRAYRELPVHTFTQALKENGVLYDLKSLLAKDDVEAAGKIYLSL